MTVSAGTKLGPYEIVSPAGAGGMGEVYRARDTRLNREVAIKVLPAAFTRDPERLRRFQQEAQAAAALNHPNILAVHDFGEQEGSSSAVEEERIDGAFRSCSRRWGLVRPRKLPIDEWRSCGRPRIFRKGSRVRRVPGASR